MKKLTELYAWKQLEHHANDVMHIPMSYYKKQMLLQMGPIELDYSRQRIEVSTLDYLLALAEECHLEQKIKTLFNGGIVNTGENKPALHTALRNPEQECFWVNGMNIMPSIQDALEQVKVISDKIRAKEWLGFSGLPITNIVNIGMGGSDLGPRFCVHALKDFCSKALRYFFVPDADPESIKSVLECIDPKTTLFIISSKSFTTKETLMNARQAMALYETAALDKHFIAVTAKKELANQFGIQRVLPIWDWVGGRYSLCSAINLITAIAIGFEQFLELLKGAKAMDTHFLQTELRKNMPVMMALLGIWNNNFLGACNLLLLVYSQKLSHLVSYIQQLEMESCGKSVDIQGNSVNYATGPMVWGGMGNQAQHSYLQLLCQGTHRFSADFLTVSSYNDYLIHEMCKYQMKVLSDGVYSAEDVFGSIPGNHPINHIELEDCTPFSIGVLAALYEHKVYVQSVIWNINPFDQPGIEHAKLVNRGIREIA